MARGAGEVGVAVTRARTWQISDIDLLESLVRMGASWPDIAKTLHKSPESCKHKASALGFVADPWANSKRKRSENRALRGVCAQLSKAPAALAQEAFEGERDDRHVERCLAGGGFMWAELISGARVEHWPNRWTR